jgi:hypothetical protein
MGLTMVEIAFSSVPVFTRLVDSGSALRNMVIQSKFKGNVMAVAITLIPICWYDSDTNPKLRSFLPSGATPYHIALAVTKLMKMQKQQVTRWTRVNLLKPKQCKAEFALVLHNVHNCTLPAANRSLHHRKPHMLFREATTCLRREYVGETFKVGLNS